MSKDSAQKLVEALAQCLKRADAFFSKGAFPSTEAALRRGLSLLDKAPYENVAPIRVQFLRRLGDLQRSEGNYVKAKVHLQECLNLSDKALGRDNIETAFILNSIGILGKYSGDYASASRAYKRALRISRRHGLRALEATIYHNLGGLYHERHRYSLAEPYARRSLRLRHSLRGKNHPEVMADWAAYAAILQGQRRYLQAQRIYERVLKYFERRGEIYEIAVNEHNLGVLSYRLKDLQKARAHLSRSLSLKEKYLGRQHPDYAFTLCSLGVLHLRLGEKETAKKMLTESLAVFQRRLGRKHAYVSLCRKYMTKLN